MTQKYVDKINHQNGLEYTRERLGPFQNFNRSQVIGRSVSFSDPARPPGGGVGRPKHPQNPPQKKCVSEPQEHFFLISPPPNFGVLRPQEHFLAIFFFSYPPSPQDTHLNPRAIISNPTIAVRDMDYNHQHI